SHRPPIRTSFPYTTLFRSWHYVRAGCDAAVSAWIGVFPLVSRDVTWSELPRGGRLRQVRAVVLGGTLAFPLLVVFGGLFSSADRSEEHTSELQSLAYLV